MPCARRRATSRFGSCGRPGPEREVEAHDDDEHSWPDPVPEPCREPDHRLLIILEAELAVAVEPLHAGRVLPGLERMDDDVRACREKGRRGDAERDGDASP